jgi:hypothetical protein
MVVENVDVVTLTPTSDGVEREVSADDTLEWDINFNNQGNRDLELTAYVLSTPNGWSLSGTQNSFTVISGEQFILPISLNGNGLAKSGELNIRFVTDDGFTIDWNRTIDVISGAIPTINFFQVALPDGTSANTPLGVDSHPVGGIGFDLLWQVSNSGTMTWRPSVSMELPDDDWQYSCSSDPTIMVDSTVTVICNVIIPLSAEAGSEPSISLILDGGGIISQDTISLYVESISKVSWTIIQQFDSPQGYTNQLSLEIQNVGNSDISEILQVDAPSGWNELILDSQFVNLRPGETRSVEIGYNPSQSSDGIITVSLSNSDEIEDSVIEVEIDVLSNGGSEEINITNILLIILIIILLSGGLGLAMFVRRGGEIQSLIPEKVVVNLAPKEDQEVSSGVPCWICSVDITIGKAWACLECGARYHKDGQIQGCSVIERGNCLHCGADIDQLAEV